MIVPVIITAVGIYFFSRADRAHRQPASASILAHTALGDALRGDHRHARRCRASTRNLVRAAASLGASPLTAFLRVMLPLILPGVVSGALFAFATSFDEVVIVLFMAGPEQRTLPRQMWSGIREQISPTILAVATLLILVSGLILAATELLRGRSRKATD